MAFLFIKFLVCRKMKLDTIDGEKGYILTAASYNSIKEITINDKIFYFMPVKYKRDKQISIEEIMEKLIAGKTKKEIAEEFGCDINRLNNILIKHHKTSNLKTILN